MEQDQLISDLMEFSKGSVIEHLGIRFTHAEAGLVKASMPVDHRTIQPYGVLHGGVSAVLAETLGSIGSHRLVEKEGKKAYGIEITTQHLRPVMSGEIHGSAKIIQQAKSIHTWSIDIHSDEGKLISISKLIVAIK